MLDPVYRLCRSVEMEALEEALDDLHDEKNVLTVMLLKQEVLGTIQNKVDRVQEVKHKFDVKYDLIPHEPKSRIQLMMEARRKKKEEMKNKESNDVSKRCK